MNEVARGTIELIYFCHENTELTERFASPKKNFFSIGDKGLSAFILNLENLESWAILRKVRVSLE